MTEEQLRVATITARADQLVKLVNDLRASRITFEQIGRSYIERQFEELDAEIDAELEEA